jgi:hypothetical protein
MSRGGIKSQTVENSVVGLGGNEFETGSITVAAKSVIKKGTVLKRVLAGFAPLADSSTEKPVAVNPFDIENDSAASKDLSFRALISGPVRADLLTVNGAKTTDAENDLLKGTSIIPIKVQDISHTK